LGKSKIKPFLEDIIAFNKKNRAILKKCYW